MREGVPDRRPVSGQDAVDDEHPGRVGRSAGPHVEPARRRGDLEAAVEERQHDERQPERRRRHADQAEDAGHVVDPAVPPHGGGHAERHTDHDGEEARDRRQLDRRRDVLPDVVEHRAAGRDRLAEVAAGEPGEEDPVLLVQRPVQAPARPEAGDGLRVGRLLVPELGEDGIGRDAVGDEEDDQGGRRGHRGRGDHPEEDVPEAHPLHGWVVSRGASLLPATLPAIRRFHVGHAGYFAGFTSYRSTCHPAAVSR